MMAIPAQPESVAQRVRKAHLVQQESVLRDLLVQSGQPDPLELIQDQQAQQDQLDRLDRWVRWERQGLLAPLVRKASRDRPAPMEEHRGVPEVS